MQKIITLDLPVDHHCFDDRNYFVASYMMFGMNFADMAYLKKTDIVNERIQYRRRKTSKLYDIKISEGLSSILSHYNHQYPSSTYLFPILKRHTAVSQGQDIQNARKTFNQNLKEIGRICGIRQNITSYVSRHSFATHAMINDIPINAISAMLGHSSIKTTEIYLQSLPKEELDNYNTKLMSLIM